MINEKKLIECLEVLKDKCWNRAKKENNINFARKQLNISQIIGIINTQPKIGNWIPCSERLPEENQNVIACFAHGLVTELAFYDGKFHGIYSYNTEVITAWQPLPEAYHE